MGFNPKYIFAKDVIVAERTRVELGFPTVDVDNLCR